MGSIHWRSDSKKAAVYYCSIPPDLRNHYGKKQDTESLGYVPEKDWDKHQFHLDEKFAKKYDKKRRELAGETTISNEIAEMFADRAIVDYRESLYNEDKSCFNLEFKEVQEELKSISLHAENARRFVKILIDHNDNDLNFVFSKLLGQYKIALADEIAGLAQHEPALIAAAEGAIIKNKNRATVNEWSFNENEKHDITKPTINAEADNMGTSKKIITIKEACELAKKSRWWGSISPKTRLDYEPSFEILCSLLGNDRQVHTILPQDIAWLYYMYANIPHDLDRSGNIQANIESNINLIKKGSPKAKRILSGSTKNK